MDTLLSLKFWIYMARLQIGLEPEGEEMPGGEEEPQEVEAETDPSFIVKGRKK